MGLCGRGTRPERGANEGEKKAKAFHIGSDAKHCSKRWKEVRNVEATVFMWKEHHYK